MKKGEKAINIVMMFILPIIIFYLFEFFLRNPFEKMKFPIQFLNILFFEILFFLLLAIFGKVRTAVRIEAILAIIVGLVNYFVIQFRSAPVMPWDLFSISTAASVANNYQYRLNSRAVIVLLLLLMIAIFCQKLKLKITTKLPIRIGCIAVALLCLFGYTKYVQREQTVKTYKLYDKLFTPTTMTYRDGTVVAFIMELKYMYVEKPSGYHADRALALLNSYDKTDETTGTAPVLENGTLPNIIVIMNEAFSDLSVLGDYETNMDEIPYMRSLMADGENTISGYLDVSVLGGNTANTEFEFLTGDTMAFLPQGSIPYQQYVRTETDSLASYLKSFDYQTLAIHPYRAKGWDRDKVYDRFGFDHFYSQNDFENPQIIREYISDQSDVDKIKELYEAKDDGTPLFIFNVTMQNHSSYTEEFENFTPDIHVTGSDSYALDNYLSLLKKSDESLADIISYFDEQEEPTIIVFFGDHQPTNSVVSPIYKLNGKSVSSLSEEELRNRYKVPFIIHANYDIAEESGLTMSANYLGTKVLKTAGIPLNAYQNYLDSLYPDYPSVSAMQITSGNGKVTSVDERKELLSDYQVLQYYHLFH